MITKLTKEQEEQIPVFMDKYIKLAEKPTDRVEATKAVQGLYENAKYKKPIVIFGKNPIQTILMVSLCKILFKEKVIKEGNQLDSQLYRQLDSQLRNQLYSQLDSQLDSQLKDINNNWWLVVWWLAWAGWYAYGEYIGVKFDSKTLKIFMDFVTNVSFIIPYEGIAFVSETPEKISWSRGLLHNESRPAVKYAGNYGLYSLNGVRFDEELFKKVISPDFSFADRMKIVDIDQRTQAINPKFCDIDAFIKEAKGQLLDEINKVDIEGNPVNYKLYMFPKGDIFTQDAYYCYFDCPSTRKKHLEGVEVSKNVAEAMAWAEEISPEDWKLRVPLLHEN